jgi:phosphodiesterase/alkaline phosphatase D-like protein
MRVITATALRLESGRVARRLPIAFLVVLLLFAAGATSALAVINGHTYAFSFGEPGKCDEYIPPEEFEHCTGGQFNHEYGWGLDVDTSTGYVYVSDPKASRIQKFDQDGNFILTWGFGVKDGANELQVCEAPEPCQDGIFGNAPGQMQDPIAVAVDNSGGPNDGDVYVADVNGPCCGGGAVGQNLILKYSGDGDFLGTINGEASPSGVFKALPWHRAVDVDNQGVVWVADEDNSFSFNARYMRFSSQANNAYIGGSEVRATISEQGDTAAIFSLAAGPPGTYVYGTEYRGLFRYVTNGSAFRHVFDLPEGYFGTEITIDPSNEHLYVATGGELQEYRDDPLGAEKIAPVFGEGQICTAAGMSINPNTGYLYVGDECGSKVAVYKPRRVPETTTEPASNIGHTSGTINGHTAPDPIDGGNVGECYFEWGLTTTYEHVDPCEPTTPISGPTDVSVDLSGLQQESTYHYRLVAANSIDTQYGADRTFTPQAVLGVSTDDATGVSSHDATLNGSFETGGESAEYRFEWGKLAANLNHVTPLGNANDAPGTTGVSTDIEGLEDYTEYFFRITAVNGFGTSHGPVRTFRTEPADPPTVSSAAADAVSDDGAHLSAAVVPNFGETIYGFEYGETLAYGKQTLGSAILGADDQSHPIEADIAGLEPGQIYHYRALAINFGGISYSADGTFTTLDVPKIISQGASSVTDSSARLSALVHPSLSATTVHFEYGTSTAYGASTGGSAIGDGGSPVSTGSDLTGLAPGTTYHFRVVAANSIGTETGPDRTFTTTSVGSPPPPPEPKCKTGFVKRGGKCVKRPCKRGTVARHGKCVRKKSRAKRHRHRQAKRGHRRADRRSE